MKSILCALSILIASAVTSRGQNTETPKAFTKNEILETSDCKKLLSELTSKDYNKSLIRNFHLCVTIPASDSTQTKITEYGPGGNWSTKQRELLEKYGKAGALFTLENILLMEPGNRKPTTLPSFSFYIK